MVGPPPSSPPHHPPRAPTTARYLHPATGATPQHHAWRSLQHHFCLLLVPWVLVVCSVCQTILWTAFWTIRWLYASYLPPGGRFRTLDPVMTARLHTPPRFILPHHTPLFRAPTPSTATCHTPDGFYCCSSSVGDAYIAPTTLPPPHSAALRFAAGHARRTFTLSASACYRRAADLFALCHPPLLFGTASFGRGRNTFSYIPSLFCSSPSFLLYEQTAIMCDIGVWITGFSLPTHAATAATRRGDPGLPPEHKIGEQCSPEGVNCYSHLLPPTLPSPPLHLAHRCLPAAFPRAGAEELADDDDC